MKKEIYARAVAADTFNAPLRNIRAALNGTNLRLDLIPSRVLNKPVGSLPSTGNSDVDEALSKMTEGARPIVEDERVFRVYFESVQAFVVQEEFVELFDELDTNSKDLPELDQAPGCFPFLRVENSIWRSTLPDFQGGDWPELEHYKLVSMETFIDILGILTSTEWVRNIEAEF